MAPTEPTLTLVIRSTGLTQEQHAFLLENLEGIAAEFLRDLQAGVFDRLLPRGP